MGRRIYPRRQPPLFIKEWREKKDLSQEELGARDPLNVSGVTIGRWENWRDKVNGRRPDLNTLAALAEALDVPLGYLFRHPETPSADELLRGQPPEVVDYAFRMLKGIARQ